MRNHNSIATLVFSFLVGLVGPLTLVIAAVLISPNTLSAQANVSCGLSTPLGSTPRASSSGHTEPIAAGLPIAGPGFELSPPTAGGGILRVTCSNTGATGTPGVVALTISLGAPITNTTSHPHPAQAIRIINRTGDFDSLNVGINSINNAGGAIAIGLGTAQPSPTTGITFNSGITSSFDLAGVLVSTNGRSTPVTAGLTSNGGVTISLANVQVIDSVMPSFSDPSVSGSNPPLPGVPPGSGPAIVNQGGNVVRGNFTLRVQENYPDAFRSSTQFNGGGVFPQSPASSTQLTAFFNSIPSGLAITNCFAALTDVTGNPNSGFAVVNFTSVTPAFPLLTINFVTPLSLSNIDVVWLTCSVAPGTAVLPLPLTPVTAQVTMQPVGAALGPSGNPLTTLVTGQVPRYQQAMQPATPVPVVLFPPDPPQPEPAALPAITGMTPSVGTFGRTVNAVITGRNFGTVTDVWFGGSSPGVVAMIGSGRTDTSLPVTITILPQAVDGPYIVTVVGSTGPSEGFSAFTVRGTTPLAWGSNIAGQFARPNPQTNLSPRPVVNLGPGSAISVAAGSSHNLALSADGTVWAWGNNTSGQLGDGTTIPRLSPVQVSGLGPGSGVVAIAAGNVYSLALKMNGTVLAWGSNTTGQLGDGSTTTRLTPVQVSGFGAGSGVVKIAASFGGVLGSHSLALKSDGTVVAWGLNSNGQLGDGTTTQRLSPVPITALGAGVADIAAGGAHSLARKSDGSVFAWGLNSGGQLGDGTILQRNTPVPVSTLGSNSGVLFLAGGQLHSLALKSDGTVLAWGTNFSGQLGDGSFVQKLTPVPVSDPSGIGMLTGVLSISAGNLYSLALKSDHTAYGWGANGSGTLGTGNTIGSPIPVPVGGSTPIGGLIQVAAAISHSLALTQDGLVLAWGSNSNGQLGNGSFDGSAVPVGIDVFNNSSPSPTAIASSSGGAQSALAKFDGSVSTWGGSSTSTTPVPVNSLPPVPTLALAVGSGITGSHMLALKSDGTVYAWGTNTSGQLGDGTAISRTNAMPVGVPVGMIAVAAGSSHSLALHSDGTVWGWGSNSNGQLGDGTIQSRSIPSPILGLTGVAAIAAGGSLSFALRSDGTLWAWGINTFGQLGDGTTIQRTVPVQVRDTTGLTFLTGVAAIVAGGSHTLAEKPDGTVLAWGLNTNGQLGDGTIVSKSLPTPVSGLGVGSGIIKLAAGGVHSLALKSDGALWAWGGNTSGQLGDGTLENRRTPVQVLTNDFLGIAAGSAHSLALGPATSSDTTPPVITPNISGTAGTNGWYRSNVTVAWDVSDPESGITSTSGCFPTTLTVETSGITLLCSAADGAGLAISASVTIKIDKTAPVVSSTRTTANAHGWNKGDVLVHFSATDALSGINGSASLDRNISTEGLNQSAIATFTDLAGNSFTARVDGINIDKTRPITSANATPGPNANGWNNTDVTVTFTGVDSLSGIASCSAPVLITTEGMNQSASGTCADLADNVSAPATATINIDKTAPVISGMPAPNCAIWPPNKKLVEIAAIKVTDDAAGVAPGSLTIEVTSNEPVDATDIVVQDGVVQVRADRLGDSTDRIYTINARVSDLAGNAMNVAGSCTVPHNQAN